MPYYGDALPYYYGGPFSNHSSLMTGTGRTIHSPLGSSRYAPLLSTISESPLSALRRYSPAATATISSRPKRVIDTADIDVSTPRALSHSDNNQHRNRLRRDRPTIRIRSQALKDNPALREHYERHEKTVGELLVEKFLIKDKKTDSDQEIRPKLYSQISLESAGDKNQCEEFQEALQRRVTRRMTRRRSSADIQMDPEQHEREVLIAQAQADALDTLVAQEQAEIEVETRMGTLIRKNLVRATPSVLGKHESQSADDDDDMRTKKLAKKVKKRKKTTDKPSPPNESEFDSETDARKQETQKENINVPVNGNDAQNGDNSSASKALKFKIEASNSVGDFSTLWINAGVPEKQEMQKENLQSIVEQFRDSVRLPAPRIVAKVNKDKAKETIDEEHQQVVVLPVRKRYVKDDSRNSVYLTLKTQKNGIAPKVAEEMVDKVDRVDKVDKVDDRSTTNGNADDAQRLTTTLLIGSQPRGQKVAKFRSKDITESDVEVKSISELPGVVEGPGERWTKDAGIDQPSIDSGRSDESEKKSISLSENSNETSGVAENPTFRRETSKDPSVISDASTTLESNENRDLTNLRNITSKKKLSSREITQNIVSDNRTNDKEANKAKEDRKDDVKIFVGGKNDKQSEKNINGKGIEERRKITKRNPNILDSLSTNHLEKSKNDEQEKLVGAATESILSVVSPLSIAESLPNAPTINLLDVHTVHTADQPVKSCGRESNGSSYENEKLDTQNNEVNDAFPGFAKISAKLDETETSKPIAVTNTGNEVDGPESLRKVISKPKTDVQPLKIESPKSGTSKTNGNLFKFKEVDKDAGKNVEDVSKLQNNHKVLGKLSNLDCNQSDEVRPESPNLKVVPGFQKKNALVFKKRDISTADSEKRPQSPVEKDNSSTDAKKKLRREKDAEKITKNLTKTETHAADLQKTNDESSKLTNGLSKLKLAPIEKIRENRELVKSEKSKLRIWNKPDTPPIQEDDGIDFWGEIESQRVVKPVPKTEIKEQQKICIVEKEANDSAHEVKPNLPAETSTQVALKVAETVVGEEKRPNKIKKKKTMESGVCKKKDQEKATAETIFERVTSGEGVDKNSPQQQQQQKLSGTSLENETSEKKSCENHEGDRFERNLSIITEENSPVSPEAPKIENLESILLFTKKESTETKLECQSDLVSDKPDITTSKESESINASKTEEPEVTLVLVLEVNESIDKTATKSSEVSAALESLVLKLPSTESALPTIHIVAAPGTPPNDEENQLLENQLEEINQEEEREGPGTPTNETSDEQPKNISKWNGQTDLSLDEPDKDIGPEVSVVTKKTQSSKKKTSTKKNSSKKSSKGSGGSNSPTSPGASPDSSKIKKLAKRKKSSSKAGKDSEKRTIFEERSESKISNSSDTTLKPSGLNLRNSPKNSPRNTPKQRPLDLIKMFYTTPASLLTATPRDLSKVRRAKIKKKKHSTRTASASSDSTGSTRSTQSTVESAGSTEHEDDVEQKRISSTRSNDSGFDGSPRLSNCDMACHKKCEKLTGNLCGLNQKLVAEALQALKRAPSQSSDNQRNSDGSDHHHASGRITPPATNLPRFKKYTVMDFNFLKVLGKGSFGKVLLAELRRTDCVYAVKCLKKDVVLEDDDVECTLIERKVLTLATRHPYLCHLFCTFQTDSHLFFVMEYLNGGDLMFHIQKSGRFAETRARFYAAEIWSGLNFLHKKGIVYRDLKLDNVLLDFEGHIRIADFGMCKLQIFLDRTADTFCGTPDYMAPEIIKGLKYNQAVDWWSFGVLLYEMLTGQSPFSGCDEDELFWSICNERPFIPRYLTQEAMDVLVCLLEKDAGKRPLAHDIAIHPFFHSTQWDRLERRQLEPPFKPALEHTLDTRYFDTAFTAERPRLTPVPEQILTSMDQGVFRGFSYTNPNATD